VENSGLVILLNFILLLLATLAKHLPSPLFEEGNFYVAFAKQKKLLLATVSLFEEGVREMLAIYHSPTLSHSCKNISPSPSSKRGIF
tara:strand:+ start:41636 stop:41896 length:261 start_codon:yes stop_codon:yes gene_type:complete